MDTIADMHILRSMCTKNASKGYRNFDMETPGCTKNLLLQQIKALKRFQEDEDSLLRTAWYMPLQIPMLAQDQLPVRNPSTALALGKTSHLKSQTVGAPAGEYSMLVRTAMLSTQWACK